MKQYYGGIFDLDGTVLDSMKLWEDVDRAFFAKRHIPYPKDYLETVGTMGVETMATYTKERFSLPDTKEEILKEWADMSREAYRGLLKLKKGAEKYLRFLKGNGVPLAIASVSKRELVESALESNGIRDCFSVICSIEDVSRSKDFPDIYLLAAKRLGLSPEQCLVFEDLSDAMESARRGGFDTVGVWDNDSPSEESRKRALGIAYVKRLDELVGETLFSAPAESSENGSR